MAKPRVVVSSHNLKSTALKNLANGLSEKLGYKVFRVKSDRIRKNHKPVLFYPGINKVVQLRSFKEHGVPCPPFATNLEEAKNLGTKKVVVRALTNASEGRGITVCPIEEVENYRAPLYTGYIPKKLEYRVHVFDGKIIDIQQKKKRKGSDNEASSEVRNTANGWVFCRSDVNPPESVGTVALAAVNALGRTQGAVDVGYNEKKDLAFVLEVNSRPGMEGTTIQKYVNAVLERE